METPLLAVAMIVKDEEFFLPGCLKSLSAFKSVISEVCIYDTGSVDRTVEIAEAAGARVKRGYWDNNFARARNVALEMCNAKWVLTVDADERLVGDPTLLRQELRRALTANMTGANVLQLQVCMVDLDGVRVSAFWHNRLFRAGKVFWEGRIHEHAVPMNGRLVNMKCESVRLDHHGYSQDLDGVKGHRNLVVAQAEAANDDPRAVAPRNALHVARSYMELGDLEEAVSWYTRVWQDASAVVGERSWAGEGLTEALLRLGLPADAAVVARELQELGVAPDLARWLLAQCRLQQGRDREAWELLRVIKDTIDSAGLRRELPEVVAHRMDTAVRLGEFEDALGCAVRLLTSERTVSHAPEVAITLWGENPPEILAQVLWEAAPGDAARTADRVKETGERGEAIAEALKQFANPS